MVPLALLGYNIMNCMYKITLGERAQVKFNEHLFQLQKGC